MTAKLAANRFMWSWEDYRGRQFTPVVRIGVCGVAMQSAVLLSSNLAEERILISRSRRKAVNPQRQVYATAFGCKPS